MEILQFAQVQICPIFVVLIIIKHNQLHAEKKKSPFSQPSSEKADANRELSGNCVTAGFKGLGLKILDESISHSTLPYPKGFPNVSMWFLVTGVEVRNVIPIPGQHITYFLFFIYNSPNRTAYPGTIQVLVLGIF